jgi:hypothetical protein
LEPTLETSTVALDVADTLYAIRRISASGKPFRVVTKYSPSGETLRRYGFVAGTFGFGGLAPLPFSPGGVVSAVDEGSGVVRATAEPPAGPVVAGVGVASPVGNVRASFEANVDPEDRGTEYHFEYVDQRGFEEQGGFSGPHTKSTSSIVLPGAPDFELHQASASVGCLEGSKQGVLEGTCLAPSTLYHYRVLASSSDGGGNSPVAGTFETAPALRVEETFASEVGSNSGRVSAKVNPMGVKETTGYFEYVTDPQFRESGFAEAVKVPNVDDGASPLDFGSGETGVTRSVMLQLSPGATYHVRLKATDALLGQPVDGKERVVSTFAATGETQACPFDEGLRSGPSTRLPDCRAYEMVSPIEKEGSDIVTVGIHSLGLPIAFDESAVSGEKLDYGAYRAFGDAQSAPFTSQYLASRTPGGWVTHDMSAAREKSIVKIIAGEETELTAMSSDLCQSWWATFEAPVLAPGAIEGQRNLYRRQDDECGGKSYEAITRIKPAHPNDGNNHLAFEGASADGQAAIYAVHDNLTKDAPNLNGTGFALYYQAAGEVPPSYVCILPNGKPIAGACTAGTVDSGERLGSEANIDGAISADGSRVYWTAYSKGLLSEGALYLRINPGMAQSALSGGVCIEAEKACTVSVSKEAEEASAGSASQFWGASTDGAKALFTVVKGAQAGDLYEYDASEEKDHLVARKVMGVFGASEDASYIYFTSREVLSGANAQNATPVEDGRNLYLYHAGTFHFVATLTGEDLVGDIRTEFRPYRVAPDGLQVVFMSAGSLTGYDNVDAHNGEIDAEVYVYDATASGGEGKVICVSCNPTGARPVAGTVVRGTVTRWVAGEVPLWSSSHYGSRVISKDGRRVFFESYDSLVPRDENGAKDVYEWEAGGTEGCREAYADYSVQDEGCVALISSGEGPQPSEFVDAGESGNDVFFLTGSSLVPQDPGQVDIYDARVNGGFPGPRGLPPACEGEACQGTPAPPSDLTPSSFVFSGGGNLLVQPLGKVTQKAQRATRAQKLTAALRACRAKPKRARPRCERQARRRYAANRRSGSARRKGQA